MDLPAMFLLAPKAFSRPPWEPRCRNAMLLGDVEAATYKMCVVKPIIIPCFWYLNDIFLFGSLWDVWLCFFLYLLRKLFGILCLYHRMINLGKWIRSGLSLLMPTKNEPLGPRTQGVYSVRTWRRMFGVYPDLRHPIQAELKKHILEFEKVSILVVAYVAFLLANPHVCGPVWVRILLVSQISISISIHIYIYNYPLSPLSIYSCCLNPQSCWLDPILLVM